MRENLDVLDGLGADAVHILARIANYTLARPPRFIILATPRSGTSYAARFLTELGICCSHEAYCTPKGIRLHNSHRSLACRGEASWMAVPIAAELDGLLLHQVREPLNVVKSIIRIGLLDLHRRGQSSPYTQFVAQYFAIGDDPVDAAIRFYLQWNEKAERHAAFRYRLEDIASALPPILRQIGEHPNDCESTIPTDFNARPSTLPPTYEEQLDERIFANRHFAALQAMTERYGYSL